MLTKTWHRRLCEAVGLLSVGIISLHILPFFTQIHTDERFEISLIAAVSASLTVIVSIIFYIIAPKTPAYWQASIVYLFFTITAGIVAFQNGGVESPFIALWLLASFFAGIFGIFGIIPIVIALGTYVAYEYLTGDFSIRLIAMSAFSSLMPLILGLMVWRPIGEDQNLKDMKKLSSQLSEVANKSEIVINAIGDGVMAIDGKGTIQLVNPAAQKILGWSKQDALMLNYKSVMKLLDKTNKEPAPAHDPINQVLNNNQQIRSNDLSIVTKSGKRITASIVASPIGDPGAGAITVFRDITKEKAEEREQAEFVSTASHEMRTPVASIEGYLGLALNPSTAQIDDKAREFLTKAHESAQHLGRLFQDLLDVTKTDDGRMTILPKVVDIIPFTESIVQGFHVKATEKGLKITYTSADSTAQKKVQPVYFVNLDNDHIREILDNLIDNAIKYTPQGEVTVSVEGLDDKVVISVKDTGLGIPAEDLPHLFQKFYRVENVDRQSIGGTGLGLYLSHRLAENMGGRLWAESIYGQGSTFHLELPRIDSQKAAELKQQQTIEAQQATLQQQMQPPVQQMPFQDVQAIVQPAQPSPIAPQPQIQTLEQHTPTPTAITTSEIKPATTVPRGESLTREQIADHVKKLEAMARSQSVPQRPNSTSQPPTQQQ